jgi:hypothetical protein
MPIDDLDLEFEDEDEAKKKKSEALEVSDDLEFSLPESGAPKGRPSARPLSANPPSNSTSPNAIAEVKNLAEARKDPPVKRPASAPPVNAHSSAPKVVGTSALKEESRPAPQGEEVIDLEEKMRRVEFDARVKVAIAEHKTELLGDLLGDIRLMEHQVGQLLARINTKHSDLKQEVLMIKKILADFTAKKRK